MDLKKLRSNGAEDMDTEDTSTEGASKENVKKLKDAQVGGNTRVVDGYIKEDKECNCGKEPCCCCASICDYAPELSLDSKKCPEVLDYEMGDDVTVKMKVTGLRYEVKDGKDYAHVTLSLTAK